MVAASDTGSMSHGENSKPPVFRVAPEVLSIDARDGHVFFVAPVGEPEGPFHISIIKFTDDEERPRFVASWPISDAIPTHREAVARLHVGFELSKPLGHFDEPVQSLLSKVMVEGMLRPVLPADTRTN